MSSEKANSSFLEMRKRFQKDFWAIYFKKT